MRQTTTLRLFLASPGDVQAERVHVREVVDEINRTIGHDKGVHLELVTWETDAVPAYGADAQQLLNAQIADMSEVDLFVGIMWNRFGQPTPRAGSGTEEEFNRAVASYEQSGRPWIMFYFNQASSNLTTQDEIEQKGKVIALKSRVRQRGMTWDYSGVATFRNDFQRHLSDWLLEETRGSPEPPAVVKQTGPAGGSLRGTSQPEERGEWIYLDNTFYVAESLAEDGAGTLTIRISPRDGEEDALLRGLRQRAGSVSYAYQNQAALVEVRDVRVQTTCGSTVFSLILKNDESMPSGNLFEASLNDITPDDLALMRARLLLLDEQPRATSCGLSLRHFVSGMHAPVKVEKGLFTELWRKLQVPPELFLELARLVAVHDLKLSLTVEHILLLDLGPIEDGRLKVSFRGRRRRVYTNVEPTMLAVEGECAL